MSLQLEIKNITPHAAELPQHGFQAVFAQMTSIVEHPEYPLLQSYKDDLYKHDREVLETKLVPGIRFLWVVNLSGTHLVMLGVHEKAKEWAKAIVESGIRSTSAGCEIYLITYTGVKRITERQANTAIHEMQYLVDKGNVVRTVGGELLGVCNVAIQRNPGDGDVYANVMIQTAHLVELSLCDLSALREIALGEATAKAQTLFVKVEGIQLNGTDIDQLIANQKAKVAI